MSDLIYFLNSFFMSFCFGFACNDYLYFGSKRKYSMLIWFISNAHYYYYFSEIFYIDTDIKKREYISSLVKIYFDSIIANLFCTGLLIFCTFSNKIYLPSSDIVTIQFIQLLIYLHQAPDSLSLLIAYVLIEMIIINTPQINSRFLDKTKEICLVFSFIYLYISIFYKSFNYDYVMTEIILVYSEVFILFIICAIINSNLHHFINLLYQEHIKVLEDQSVKKVRNTYLQLVYYEKSKLVEYFIIMIFTYIIPIFSYFVEIYLFQNFQEFILLFFIVEIAEAVSFTLTMSYVNFSMKSIQLNRCSLVFVWVLFRYILTTI